MGANFFNLSLKLTNSNDQNSHVYKVIENDQSQMSDGKIPSIGKMLLMAK